eukprot:7387755-Prymnesium_polylepis.3
MVPTHPQAVGRDGGAFVAPKASRLHGPIDAARAAHMHHEHVAPSVNEGAAVVPTVSGLEGDRPEYRAGVVRFAVAVVAAPVEIARDEAA